MKYSKKSFRLFGFLAIAFALFIIAGGPLMVLQGVAWGNMIQQYSKNDTLAGAFQKTFSGKYRCSLCKKIAEQTKKEQKTTALSKVDKSLKAACCEALDQLHFCAGKKFSYEKLFPSAYQSISYEPPEPYPRVASRRVEALLLCSCVPAQAGIHG